MRILEILPLIDWLALAFFLMGWFFSPVALLLATLLVIFILFGCEFRSEVLAVMRE
mgnify:FL=1